ncbi:type I pantothenate kinase [Priestia megaterium]|uniref:type I pantothenate kinase n=1 Tax=Priestia megaterium TaxID=1404 RepID=UPI0036DC7CF7
MSSFTPYFEFNRKKWASLRNHTPLPLTEEELESLKGLNVEISIEEVEKIYLPLTRLINLYVKASQQLHTVTTSFLGNNEKKVPYIIGIAGSVAVGKSTTARLLQTLLSRWDNHRKVDLVTTDGFLYSTDLLKKNGLMKRKGFPESYDTQKLIDFIADVKSGKNKVEAPIYSHMIYDVLPNQVQTICTPDILILEGINVLQVNKGKQTFVSDFFDFSIYVDAEVSDIKRWYIERFLLLQETAFQNPNSYFHRYTNLSKENAVKKATQIWEEINLINLDENILPTRGRAHLVLKKDSDHKVKDIYLRKL